MQNGIGTSLIFRRGLANPSYLIEIFGIFIQNEFMKIIHQKTNTVLGKNLVRATSFWRRLRGYMFYESPKLHFDGLFFPHSRSAHNFFVRFPIDVVFIDENWEIVKILRGFRPWRFSGMYFNATHMLEFPAGTVEPSVSVGDKLISL